MKWCLANVKCPINVNFLPFFLMDYSVRKQKGALQIIIQQHKTINNIQRYKDVLREHNSPTLSTPQV